MTDTIDYKHELESASKGMIMIHDPELLIKLIVRMIVSKVQLEHAGVLLRDPRKECYVLKISRGAPGVKIPAGFARFTHDHPLVEVFRNDAYKSVLSGKPAIQAHELNSMIWQDTLIGSAGPGSAAVRELLHRVSDQMRDLNIVAAVPAVYQAELLAVLLLGGKKDGTRFEQAELDFFAALASDTAMAIRNAQLFADLKRESQRNRELFLRTTVVLGAAIEAKDKYTHGHTERVTEYSVAIARQMRENGTADFSDSFFESLYIASMLHDIGKIGVPESVLNKEGPLTKEEFDRMKRHTIHGVEILKPLSELKESLAGVRYHHERYDGRGYPDGLKGEDIPMIAAVIAVADTFDAMTTDRPYRKGLSREEAIAEIRENIGTQFNPKPAKAMIELYQQGKL